MALPVLHRRRSKRQRALNRHRTHAKAWVIVKATKVGHRAARKGVKTYGMAKGKKAARPIVMVLAVPVVAGGAVVAWRKVRSDQHAEGARAAPAVASADSVSPPAARADHEPRAAGPPADADLVTAPYAAARTQSSVRPMPSTRSVSALKPSSARARLTSSELRCELAECAPAANSGSNSPSLTPAAARSAPRTSSTDDSRPVPTL